MVCAVRNILGGFLIDDFAEIHCYQAANGNAGPMSGVSTFEDCIRLCNTNNVATAGSCTSVTFIPTQGACYVGTSSQNSGVYINTWYAAPIAGTTPITDNKILVPYPATPAQSPIVYGNRYTSLCAAQASPTAAYAAFQTVAVQGYQTTAQEGTIAGQTYSQTGTKYFYEQECMRSFPQASTPLTTTTTFSTMFSSYANQFPTTTEQCMEACDYFNRNNSPAGALNSAACYYFQFSLSATPSATNCLLYNSATGYTSPVIGNYNSGFWLANTGVFVNNVITDQNSGSGGTFGYKRGLPAPPQIAKVGKAKH